MTVSLKLNLELVAGLPTLGKSLSLRPLSLSSPLRWASSRIRSRLLVSCFCMGPLMFEDATIAMITVAGVATTNNEKKERKQKRDNTALRISAGSAVTASLLLSQFGAYRAHPRSPDFSTT